MLFLYMVLLSVVSLTYGVLLSDTISCPPWSHCKNIQANVNALYFICCDNSSYSDGIVSMLFTKT